MAATLLSDVIKPDVFNDYIIEEAPNKSALIRSGIVSQDPRIAEKLNNGGDTVNMPFWSDLEGDAQARQSDTTFNINKIGADKDVARLLKYGNAWSSEDLAAELAGDDPMKAIASRVVEYWDREYQKILIKVLQGVFADNVANDDSDLVLDVAEDDVDTNGAVELDGDKILDAKQLLGDAKGNLTALAMHSQVHTNLQKKQLIQYDPEADADIGFGTYLGHTVIVDDGVPAEPADTTGTEYTTYLFGQGAVGFASGMPKVPTETDRNSLAGKDILVNRKDLIMHLRGIRWRENSVANDMPTYSELANAVNWDRVYNKKNIRAAAIVTNG